MGLLSAIGRFFSHRYVSVVLLAGLGIALGYLVFFNVYPHKPKIGVIDIPFTVITSRSANTISSYLAYAREDPSIKGVVIRLNSPGGAASASERLFFETRKLREEKPVVIVMGDLVASGGYMMAMGANYLFANPSSLVGNVGVIISFPGPFIPAPPQENLVITGPSKLSGGNRRDWLTMADEMKRSFGGIVTTERGSRLKISEEEVLTGRIWSGIEGKNWGLIDEIGSDTDAVEKAASLAGVSNYELVDINARVARKANETLRWVFDPLLLDYQQYERQPQAAARADSARTTDGLFGFDGAPFVAANRDSLTNILPFGGVGEGQAEALPGFPRRVNHPNIYYLYVGPTQ